MSLVTYEIFTQRGSPNEIFLAFVTISFCSRADAYLRETGEFGQRASGSFIISLRSGNDESDQSRKRNASLACSWRTWTLDYSQVADQIANRRLFFFVSTFKLERSQSIDAIIDYLFMVNISKRIDKLSATRSKQNAYIFCLESMFLEISKINTINNMNLMTLFLIFIFFNCCIINHLSRDFFLIQ